MSAILVAATLLGPLRARAAPGSEVQHAVQSEETILEGVVRTAGDRTPLADVRVLVIPASEDRDVGVLEGPYIPKVEPAWQRAVYTDEDGRFELSVPAKKVVLILLVPGYERRDEVLELPSKRTRKVFLRSLDDDPYRTVVSSTPEPTRSSVNAHELSPEEIRTLPGTQGDPLRALQNMPGVSRTPGSLGLLVLRGAPPAQSGVFIGGHRVPRAFHVLGLSSVVPAELVESLSYQPSNFDAAYGDVTGGIVVLEPRVGRVDGYHGHAELDLGGLSASVEGPVGKGSFLLAGQRSHIDAILAGVGAIQASAGQSDTAVLRPSYYDYQGVLEYPVANRGRLRLTLLGAGDRIRPSRQSTEEFENSGFDFRSDFHRIDLRYSRSSARTKFLLTPSFRYEVGLSETETPGASSYSRRDFITSVRAEVRHDVTRRFTLTVGSDFEVDPYRTVRTDFPLASPEGEQRVEHRDSGLSAQLGVYSTARLVLGPAVLEPGIRVAGFILEGQARASVDPRFNVKVQATPSLELFAGAGKYSMLRDDVLSSERAVVSQNEVVGDARLRLPPSILALNPNIVTGGSLRSIGVRQALHLSGGAAYDVDQWAVRGAAFLREQDDGTPIENGDEVIGFSTRSRAWGIEAMVRRRLSRGFYAWLTYTLMWSRRYVDRPDRTFSLPTDFDLRHSLNLLGSYRLPKRWRIGGRFRLSSGYPYTPIRAAGSHEGALYYPILGETNSRRFGIFHQLDIRVDKSWLLDRAIVTGYFEVLNVYNAQNPEAFLYSSDFRERVDAVGLPIFPMIGVRVDL